MMQTGLFDWQTRFEQLNNGGDPLVTRGDNAVAGKPAAQNSLAAPKRKIVRKSQQNQNYFIRVSGGIEASSF